LVDGEGDSIVGHHHAAANTAPNAFWPTPRVILDTALTLSNYRLAK
jgi:hypothetical protein